MSLPFRNNTNLRKYGPSLRGKIIVIEGLISAGKSTAGKKISEFLNSIGIKTKFFPEPIAMGLLKIFLSDQKKYAYAFQLAMLIKRQSIYKEAYTLSEKGYCCIIDRSLYGDLCFAKLHLKRGNISTEEWDSYVETLNSEKFNSPDYVIYLKVTPRVAIERCKKRDRDGEKTYDIKYFKELGNMYNIIIPNSSENMMVIDWNKNRSETDDIVFTLLDEIKGVYDFL